MNWQKDKLLKIKERSKELRRTIIALVLGAAVFITACYNSGNPALEREKRAEKYRGPILIGAAAPWKKVTNKGNLNWYGIELALEEINKKGGILNRKVEIVKKDDEASVNKGVNIAQEFADNLDITAVIGHAYSFISIPASVIYEFNGLVMISPAASSPKLTQRNFKRIFRVIPNDDDMGPQLADYASQKGYKKMMIYYIKDEYGLGLANAFEKRAEELGIQIFDRLSYDSTTKPRVFYNDFLKWKENYKFDAVFLAARNPVRGAEVIIQARKVNLNVPFISGDALNSQRLIDTGKEAVEGTIVPSNFYPYDKREVVQNFIESFKEKYNKMPDTWAALYYDAAKVLFYAIKKAGTTNPRIVAETLHNIKNFQGVTGNISFTKRGDVIGKKLFMKIVKNGRFVFDRSMSCLQKK